MKIWKLCFELDRYDNLKPLKPFTVEEYQSFDGRRKKTDWKKLPVKRMEPEKGLELGDAPGFVIPVFSKRALDVLRPLIETDVEMLELDFLEAPYWGINVINVLDVIDYSKSRYRTYSDGKRIMVFQKYAFRECEELTKTNIFKIKDEPTRWAFVSDEFKKLVEENNLKGFVFQLVWDSDEK